MSRKPLKDRHQLSQQGIPKMPAIGTGHAPEGRTTCWHGDDPDECAHCLAVQLAHAEGACNQVLAERDRALARVVEVEAERDRVRPIADWAGNYVKAREALLSGQWIGRPQSDQERAGLEYLTSHAYGELRAAVEGLSPDLVEATMFERWQDAEAEVARLRERVAGIAERSRQCAELYADRECGWYRAKTYEQVADWLEAALSDRAGGDGE